ncbi:MAG: carbohydrate porin [Calditrichia bacterium]
MYRGTRTAVLVFIILVFLNVLYAQGFWNSLARRNTLTGDWWGIRSALARQGLEFSAFYTGQVFADVSGGLRRGSVYLDDIDIMLEVDTDKLLNWKGGEIFLYFMGLNGKSPEKYIGDVQVVSNIAAYSTWKLYEFYVQQKFFHQKLSLLTGLYDLNSEFDVLRSALVYINASHGIDPTFSQSGRNGPSIFPYTTLGIRARLQPRRYFGPGARLILVEYNISKGSFWVPYPIPFPEWKTLAGIAGFPPKEEKTEYSGKFALGYWFYTARFRAIFRRPFAPDPGASNPLVRGSGGGYLLFEKVLFRENQNPDRRLMFFTRLGIANDEMNRFAAYYGWGLTFYGLIPGRKHDIAGVAIAIADNGDDYKNEQLANGLPVYDAEWNFEFTYLSQITPWLALQPDIQYVIHPNTSPAIKNALALAFSLNIAF